MAEEATTTRVPTILLIDDDVEFLELLQSLLRTAEQGWEVLAAQTPNLALTMLAGAPIDLAVLDLRMPGVNGLEFLELIGRKYPLLRKVVLSGYVDEAFRASVNNAGADLVIEKPTAASDLHDIISVLAELLRAQRARPASSRMRLEDVIHVECMSRHSTIIEVGGRENGRLFIHKGAMVHAEHGAVTGEPALLLLLKTTDPFRYASYSEPPQRTLHGGWDFLLSEAVAARDGTGGVAGTAAEVAAPAAAAPLTEMVVADIAGRVLYAWQARAAPQTAELLAALGRASRSVEALVPLGALEHVEFYGAPQRVVARFSTQGAMLVRGTAEHG